MIIVHEWGFDSENGDERKVKDTRGSSTAKRVRTRTSSGLLILEELSRFANILGCFITFKPDKCTLISVSSDGRRKDTHPYLIPFTVISGSRRANGFTSPFFKFANEWLTNRWVTSSDRMAYIMSVYVAPFSSRQ